MQLTRCVPLLHIEKWAIISGMSPGRRKEPSWSFFFCSIFVLLLGENCSVLRAGQLALRSGVRLALHVRHHAHDRPEQAILTAERCKLTHRYAISIMHAVLMAYAFEAKNIDHCFGDKIILPALR